MKYTRAIKSKHYAAYYAIASELVFHVLWIYLCFFPISFDELWPTVDAEYTIQHAVNIYKNWHIYFCRIFHDWWRRRNLCWKWWFHGRKASLKMRSTQFFWWPKKNDIAKHTQSIDLLEITNGLLIKFNRNKCHTMQNDFSAFIVRALGFFFAAVNETKF